MPKRFSKEWHKENPEYFIFVGMKQRCTNPKNNSWRWYGAKGIRFEYESFEEFISDVGRRPRDDYSIDRIDSEKNYARGNCRWATSKEQANNRRSYTQYPHPRAKLSECDVLLIKKLRRDGAKSRSLAGRFHVSQHTINNIVGNRTWKATSR